MEGGLPLENNNPAGGHLTQPVLIGNNCKIADTANIGPYAVLGDGCVVNDHAVIEHSICWEGVTLGKNSHVKQSVLGNSVTVADKETLDKKTMA
jgi:mannose-1-phosphate guanylyltransferase/phosphomannomutase